MRRTTAALVLLTVSLLTISHLRHAPAAAMPTDPAPCPVNVGVCDFATRLNHWLLAGDLDALVAHVRTEERVCDEGARHGAGDTSLLCRGSQPGERRLGYPLFAPGGSAIGGLLPEQRYRESLRSAVAAADPARADDLGPGDFRPLGFLCVDETARTTSTCGLLCTYVGAPDTAGCDVRFLIMFGSIQCLAGNVGRRFVLFQVEPGDGQTAPRITMTFLVSTGLYTERSDDTSMRTLIRWTLPDGERAVAPAGSPRPCIPDSDLPDPAAALLTLDDLPPGWRRSSSTAVHDLLPEPALFCGAEIATLLDPATDPVIFRRRADATFENGPRGPVLEHDLYVFAPGEARRWVEEFRAVFARELPCAWEDVSEDGVALSARLGFLPLPTVGDESFAIRLEVRTAQIVGRNDIIVLRQGDAVATVELIVAGDGGETADTALLERLGRAAAERLATLTR